MSISMLIGGDCGPAHGAAMASRSRATRSSCGPCWTQADLRFVNCMRTYSSRGVISRARAAGGSAAGDAPTSSPTAASTRVTMANNHSYDSGPDALVDTRALFDVARASRSPAPGATWPKRASPAIVERNGVRVGYLGYSSVGKPGSDGRARQAGHMQPPGQDVLRDARPARARAHPHGAGRRRSRHAAGGHRRRCASRPMWSCSPSTPASSGCRASISDYQVAVAHAAIDAGADLVVGHAPHIPKAIEVYKGKTIFYSLGVFAMTKPFAAPSWKRAGLGARLCAQPHRPRSRVSVHALWQGVHAEPARQGASVDRKASSASRSFP